MEPIEVLSYFCNTMAEDNRIGPTHISLFLALFTEWYPNPSNNPMAVNRNKVMPLAKIAFKQTYNRCINELQQYGYIKYMPSFNPASESVVELMVPLQNSNHGS